MKPLLLVAVLPPEPVLAETWALKQEVHQLTGSRNAVRLPPHITLIPPLRAEAAFEDQLRATLAGFAATRPPFRVGLHDFAWFGDRTLFVRVSEAAALHAFHTALLAWCRCLEPTLLPEARPFTPHLTLATRDLPAAQIPALRAQFATRRYAASFVVPAVQLFRHDGQHWQQTATFELTAG